MDPKIGLACIIYQMMDMCGCFSKCKDYDGNCRTCTCSCSFPCRRKRPQQIVVVQAEEVEYP